MNKLLTLSALVLAASTAVAQTPIVVAAPSIFANAEGGTSVNIWRTVASRNQSVYDSTNFTTNGQNLQSPIEINQLEWRMGGGLVGAAVAYPSVDIYLGTSANDFATLSTTFATNRNPDHTLVYSGPINLAAGAGTTPNSWAVNVPLTTSFIYDPSTGQDLLVEFVINAAPVPATTNIFSTGFTTATHLANSVRAAGVATTGGAFSAFAPVVRFSGIEPVGTAKHDVYGQGCYTQARSFYESFPGTYPLSSNDLSGNTLLMQRNPGQGYTVLTIPGATLTLPTGTGLALPDDNFSAPIALPFTFDYPGGSTSSIIAHSNGSVILSGTPAAFFNEGNDPNTLLRAVVAALAPSLQDLLPDGATNINNVYAEPDPANPTSVFLITWLNVPCYAAVLSTATSTFQVALIDNGTDDTVEFRYQTLVNDSDSYAGAALTGFSTGGTSLNPGNRDLTAGLFSTYLNDLGALSLVGTPRPIMGTPVTYQVNNIRAGGFTLMQAGFGQDLAGTPLTLYGLNTPGCNAHLAPFGLSSFGPLLFASPTDSFSFTWPTGYPGVQLFVQAFELQSVNPENPAGILSSNGLQVLLGTL